MSGQVIGRNGDVHEDCIDEEICTIVPCDSDSYKAVLLSSRSRGSDWQIGAARVNGADGVENAGVENEDSGFQHDAIDTTKIQDAADAADAQIGDAHNSECVSEVGAEVIHITPGARTEHRILENLHSTPYGDEELEVNELLAHRKSLVAGIDASNKNLERRISVKDLLEQISPAVDLRSQNNREFNKGPDQILPSDSLTSTTPTGPVKLKIEDRGIASISPLSVPGLLQQAVSRYMDHTALSVKRDGTWIKWTYKQYLHDVRVCAKAFIRLGLERFHSVCILGFNSPEWFIADLAAIHAGGLAAGIYTTNSAEACLHCAINSQANIIVVENRVQLDKILEVKDRIPSLKAIVQYTGKPHVKDVITWSQLMNLGNSTPDNVYEDRLKKIAVNQCCTLIYTSGTTGPPKGVMLNHDNLTWISHVAVTHMSAREKKEVFISYLPLSHVAAQVVDIYVPLSCGATVYFGAPDVLKDANLVTTLCEVKPTLFFGVPRVWEKIYEKMQVAAKETRGVKRVIAKWAKKRGLEYNRRRMEGSDSKPFGFSLANVLVFKKVRQRLGLDRCNLILSGAAPLSNEVAECFLSLNIPIFQSYGMSESTGPHALNNAKGFRSDSAGKTVPGCRTVISNPDADGNGEILMAGRHVFMGYLHDENNTSSTITSQGYLHTGDVGKVDKFGFVYITGRIKELLITAGGENVAPVLIEDNVKAELSCVSQAMVVGDRCKFLSILLTLKTEVNPDTQEPLPRLTGATRQWCQEAGLAFVETVTDVADAVRRGRACDTTTATNERDLDCAKFVQAIDSAIKRANAKAISNAQRVQKWDILPNDFSVPGGELGPTMKLKRGFVVKKYAEVVERFYN